MRVHLLWGNTLHPFLEQKLESVYFSKSVGTHPLEVIMSKLIGLGMIPMLNLFINVNKMLSLV